MIKGTHLHTELTALTETVKKLTAEGKTYEASMLQASILNLKLLLNIRQNQVAIMQHEGVELIKPKVKDNGEETQG